MSKREYKSSVFSMLMEEPLYALEVFNALNNSDWNDPNLVEMKRLDNGIMLTVRNDASFVIDEYLSIYEHQSTYNPNMPLRSLIYVTDIIRRLIDTDDLYGRKRIMIPTPQFVVFYNGTENRPAIEQMRLSHSFLKKLEEPQLELICTVYNINRGKNEGILSKCKILREYMVFVDKIRDKIDSYKDNGFNFKVAIDKAIDEAIAECLEEDILKDFLIKRGNEVREVAALDYTWERREQLIARDSREEGRLEGLSEGELKNVMSLICRKLKKNKTTTQIAEEVEMEIDEATPIIEAAKKFAPDYDVDEIYGYYTGKQIV